MSFKPACYHWIGIFKDLCYDQGYDECPHYKDCLEHYEDTHVTRKQRKENFIKEYKKKLTRKEKP